MRGKNYQAMDYREIAEKFLKEYDEYHIKKTSKVIGSAITYVDILVNKDPLKAVESTMEIINICKNDSELAYVAAGPLENLFVYHGHKIINKIKEEADCNEKLQLALSGVWLDEDEDSIFPQWLKLMERYNFTGDNPRKSL